MSNYSIVVHVKNTQIDSNYDGGSSNNGHIWIEFRKNGATESAKGWYPVENSSSLDKLTGTDGYVRDDSDRSTSNWEANIPVGEDQYERMRELIRKIEENPSSYAPYSATENNCGDFVEDTLQVGGIIPFDAPTSPVTPSSKRGPLSKWYENWLRQDQFNREGRNRGIDPATATYFRQGRIPRKDPLALDLDGDGIETIGASQASAILFDHNGDGRLTGSGWVKPDDGFLVLDRNGNGTIDNGSELFGVDTPLPSGRFATTGFEALSSVDTNSDGVVNGNDGYFSALRVWRDLNQDGVSQAEELQSLASLGIASIYIKAQDDRVDLANGNVRTATGVFRRTDGTTGAAYNLELQDNPFYRRFPDPAPITDRAKALPDMKGSGLVYDMRQAASVSDTFADKLEQFASLADRQSIRANMFGLLHEWYLSTPQELAEPWTKDGLNDIRHSWLSGYAVNFHFSGLPDPSKLLTGGFDYSPEFGRRMVILKLLERFTGQHLLSAPAPNTSSGSSNGLLFSAGSSGSGGSGAISISEPTLDVSFSQQQWDNFQQSYDALTDSVYDALLPQTLIKPYLDLIDLKLDESGIHFDFTKLDAALADKLRPTKPLRSCLGRIPARSGRAARCPLATTAAAAPTAAQNCKPGGLPRARQPIVGSHGFTHSQGSTTKEHHNGIGYLGSTACCPGY